MRKIVCFLIIIISMLFIKNVYAITFDTSTLTLKPGDTIYIDMYHNFDNSNVVEFNLIYMSDKVPADFNPSNDFKLETSGVTYKLTSKNNLTGNIFIGKLKIWVNKDATNMETTIRVAGDQIGIIVDAPVPDITPDDGKEPLEDNLISKIDSKIVNITLKDKVYEYNVVIDSDILELDLNPIKKDENTIVEISTQKIEELKDNSIIITARNGEKEEKYTINVRVRPEVKEEVIKKDYNYKSKYLAFILFFGIIIVVSAIFALKKK